LGGNACAGSNERIRLQQRVRWQSKTAATTRTAPFQLLARLLWLRELRIPTAVY
jgi:hypothetical protein